jgi:hypothetical protein
MMSEIFELTEEHIKLLRSAYVGWDYCEYGAPRINPKRPYGNSDVAYDIYETLGWEFGTDENDEPDLDEARAAKIHEETETALQIVLRTGSFTPGTYVRDLPWDDWTLVS